MSTSTVLPTARPLYPLPFVVASWLGYPLDRIVAGLRAGTIAPPLGAPDGWLPAGYADAGEDSNDDAGDAEGDDTADDPQDDPDEAGADDGPFPNDGGGSASSGGDVDLPGDAGDPTPPASSHDAYRELVRAIDPSLDDSTFDAWWSASGADDPSRGGALGSFLWRNLVGGEPPASGAGPGSSADAVLAQSIARRSPHGTFVSFAGMGSEAIADLARADSGALAALAALDDHALVGLSGGPPRPGRFDAATGERLATDAWIDDRARYLAWTIAQRDGADLASVDGAGWRFVDRSAPAPGAVDVGGPDGEWNQVVFARDDGDRVDGGAAVDRLHGGAGDDTLRGAGGDDFIEGGRGSDRLVGGVGNDRLDGGSGDDDLAGGRGDDDLAGGGGDDLLEGGRGSDRLVGGDGHDVYDFSAGDGDDLIVDSDGDGEIRVDGATLVGDADDVGGDGGAGDADYSVIDDGTGGRTLVIRLGGDGEERRGGEIRVRDWRDGDLGIRLSAGTLGAGEAAAADPVDAEEASGSGEAAAAPALRPRSRDDDWSRERGNESGWGVADVAPPDAVGPTGRGDGSGDDGSGDDGADAGSPIEFGDWERAFSRRASPGGPMPTSAPDLDASALTPADVVAALSAPSGDEVDEIEFGAPSFTVASISDAAYAPGLAPPDVQPRVPA